MALESASPAELLGETTMPNAPLPGYLFRLGTPGTAYVWPFPFSPFAQVIFCGFFSSGSDWVSTVQKQATFTGVTEHWNRKPMVLWSGYLAWKPLPQSENIRAAGQSLLKQLFTQIPRRFVSGIATTATFVCGQRSRGGCQYPLPATSPVSLAKFPYCLGSMQWFQGVRIFAYQSSLNICKKKKCLLEKKESL